jgi:hypothetical protein
MLNPWWNRLVLNSSFLGLLLAGWKPAIAIPIVERQGVPDPYAQSVPPVSPMALNASGEAQGTSTTAADLEAQAESGPTSATEGFLSQVPPGQNPVTSVDDLSDLEPGIWYYDAIVNLVDKYRCVAGYPDGTFRPQRSISRAEMAVFLNNCLQAVVINQEDLETIKALQEEFAAELATLRGRVDGLEAQVKTLEAQQFSTTTRLSGEAILGFGGLAGDNVNTGDDIDSRLSFNQRTRLNFLTSFSGKDLLYTRLQSSNRPINFGGASGTLGTRIAFDTGDTGNDFILDRLDYKFPIGKNLTVTAFANAAFHHYYATTINPYFEGFGGGQGAISFFGERNPIYRIGTVGIGSVAGIGTTYFFDENKNVRLDVGYLAGSAEDATETTLANGEDEGGLIGGTFSLLGQLSFRPTEKSQIGVTYVRNHAPDGNLHTGIGSVNSILPFVDGAGVAQAFSSDSVALQGTFRITDGFAVGGWFGYTFANQANSDNNAEILNGALNLAFLDLGKEGAIGGLIVGVPPQTIRNDIAANEDPGTTIHIEANYQFPVNKHIMITPGLIYLVNPEANSANSDILVGVIRTTFKF